LHAINTRAQLSRAVLGGEVPGDAKDPTSLSKPQLAYQVGAVITTIFSVVGFALDAVGATAPSAADFLGYAGVAGAGALLGMYALAIGVVLAASLTGTMDHLEAPPASEYTIKYGAEINATGAALGAIVGIATVGAGVRDDFYRVIGVGVVAVCAYYLLYRRAA
jgi:hypothetical protein